MSAETLRLAAEAIRKEWDNEADARHFPADRAFHLAVADLIDDEARLCEDTGDTPYSLVLEVASAYLGGQA